MIMELPLHFERDICTPETQSNQRPCRCTAKPAPALLLAELLKLRAVPDSLESLGEPLKADAGLAIGFDHGLPAVVLRQDHCAGWRIADRDCAGWRL
jgi:hypothetical protein